MSLRLSSADFLSRSAYVPSHSLDIWAAARDNSANELVETIWIGDSTWWGQTLTGANSSNAANYSLIYKIRALALAAGLTDGGRGIAGDIGDHANLSGEALNGWQAGNVGWLNRTISDSNDMHYLQQPQSNVAADHVTFQGKGTYCRLNFTSFGTIGGAFTYSLDGGGAVTITPNTANGRCQTVLIGPFTEGTHTLLVTNTSGTDNRVIPEWIRATGVVFHKECAPGVTAASTLGSDATAGGRQLAMYGLTLAGNANPYEYEQAEGSHPTTRRVRLAVLGLAGNDQQGSAADNSALVQDAALRHIRLARAAGADPLIVIPHLVAFANPSWSARYVSALMEVASGMGCALVNQGESILGPFNTWNAGGNSYGGQSRNPHLNASGYDVQATGIWSALAR